MADLACPVAHVPTVDFDHHDPAHADERVWAAYEAVRAHGEVTWSPHHGGFWVITSFDGVRQALRDPETFSSGHGHRIPQNDAVRSIPIDFDPPLHTDYRALVTEALRPDKVRALRPFVTSTIGALWDALAARGHGDAVAEVALPLPLAVLERLVGFSHDSVLRFRDHTERLAATVTSQELHAIERAAIGQLLRDEIERHRRERPDDFITWLLGAEVEGRAIRDEEMVSVLNTLAVAGHETTLDSVGGLIYMLATDPELQASVRQPDCDAAAFVEEVFRLRTPSQIFGRYTTREVTVGDVTIPKDQHVMLVYAAANRDPGRYSDPASVKVGRPERGHLAFGWGVHQCVGQAVARMEMATLVEVMRRYPTFRLAGTPTSLGLLSGTNYGFRNLPIEFIDPAGEGA
jgi:cytochrome P450